VALLHGSGEDRAFLFPSLFTLNFILWMWWRRGALCLFGMELAAFLGYVSE
jgi:hypothetical protein